MTIHSFILLLMLANTAGAADVRGVVLDPAGASVPGVPVTVTTANQTTVGHATTGSDGRFRIPVTVQGALLVTAAKTGFAELQAAIDTSGGKDIDLTLRLDLGSLSNHVTVSAESSRALDVDNVAQPITLITRTALETRTLLLSEAAEGEAGVHQLRTSSTMGAIFVRGLTGRNVAVYRDGVRYTTSAQRGGVSTFLNLMQPEALDSVEILRGPNSAQYGSDSLGGTVALISRSPASVTDGFHGDVAAFYQSAANAAGPSASLGGGRGRFHFQSHLTALRSNTLRTGQGIDSHAAVTRFLGISSGVLGTRLPDTAFTSYGGSFHSQVTLASSSYLIAHYERSQQDGGKRYDQLLGGDGNLIADLRNLMLDFGYLRYQQFRAGPFDQFSITGSYNAQREERVNQGGQGNPAGAITHQYEKTKVFGAQAILEKRFGRVEWLSGGDAYFEKVAAPSFALNPVNNAVSLVRPRIPDGAIYRIFGGFTQASWRPFSNGKLRLSGALRYSGASYRSRAGDSPIVAGKPLWPDDSLAAHAFSGRFGATTWIRDWAGLHANYSRGFRAPNVTDLGTLGLQGNGVYEAAVIELTGRGAFIGDRADDQARSTGIAPQPLRPEVSDNFDAGVRIRRSKWQGDITAFWLNLRNTIISQTLILPPGVTGQNLGEQVISRQLPSGAIFVPLSTTPVLVRSNFSGARMRGIEHTLRIRLSSAWSLSENVTYLYAEDSRTGLPPDIEPGVPPLTFNPTLGWRPRGRVWFEAYGTLAERQDRLSSLALSDRRIGNPRSRANIQSFFNNGARARGLVSNGILLPTGETLTQVQNRVLGSQASAPQFTAIPGFAVFGLRGGVRMGEQTDIIADLANPGDKNYRGIGWGVDAPARGVIIRLRHRF